MWRYAVWVVLGLSAVTALVLPGAPAERVEAPAVQQELGSQLSLTLSQ